MTSNTLCFDVTVNKAVMAMKMIMMMMMVMLMKMMMTLRKMSYNNWIGRGGFPIRLS